MFGVIGPDGAGKTTAIRLAVRSARGRRRPRVGPRPRSGRASIARSRSAVGYLSQRFSLYGDLTIDENIAFFAEIHGVARYHAARDRLLDDDPADAVPRRAARIGCRAA